MLIHHAANLFLLLQVGMVPANHYGIPWGFTYEDLAQQDLSGQTAIVTGANAGLGYALTEHLYELGVEVTMVCRNPTKCENAASQIRENKASSSAGRILTATVDTGDMSKVKDFAAKYMDDNEGKALDMMFLNAGGLFRDPNLTCVPESIDGIEKVFAANYLGHHLLFRWLEPMLQKSKLARVVSTSSASSFGSYSYQVATDLATLNGCLEHFEPPGRDGNLSYGQSKLAQIVWSKYVSRQHLKPDSNIFVNSFHPGTVATEIWQKMDSMNPFGAVLGSFINWLCKEVFWTPSEGALTGLFLATATDRLVQGNIRGKYYHPQSQEVVNPVALNETLQDRLWAFSEELVKDFLPVE